MPLPSLPPVPSGGNGTVLLEFDFLLEPALGACDLTGHQLRSLVMYPASTNADSCSDNRNASSMADSSEAVMDTGHSTSPLVPAMSGGGQLFLKNLDSPRAAVSIRVIGVVGIPATGSSLVGQEPVERQILLHRERAREHPPQDNQMFQGGLKLLLGLSEGPKITLNLPHEGVEVAKT